MNNILNNENGITVFFNTYEGIATLLIVFIMVLKVLINRRATRLHFKKMLVSIPSEITFLVMGFLLSAIISEGTAENVNALFSKIVISLLILVSQYAIERWLEGKLSGRLKLKVWVVVIFMYILSILLYVCVVFGGAINE